MRRIEKSEWVPADGMELEKNAFEVVRSEQHYLVVAGPGAGKTELLAQRASYLLETNSCIFPRRILAISFKNDAAYNLRNRVKLRCGEELSKRFDSFTFDSFAKQLADRFATGIPADYPLRTDYEMLMNDAVVKNLYKQQNIDFFNTKNDLIRFHSGSILPLPTGEEGDQYRKGVWDMLLANNPPLVTFQMLMRLAQYLIDSNPLVAKYLRETYQYVFLDEFQDTTQVQYDFFKACFKDSDTVFTAVGDDKQRIMAWAGAKPGIFDEFCAELSAELIPLKMNFRSAPRLVTLQNYLTKHLLGRDEEAIPSAKWNPEQGECAVWRFANENLEIATVFDRVHRYIHEDGIAPREICILVKQQLESYVGRLISVFNANGIKARDESQFQLLLGEEFVEYVLDSLCFLDDVTLGKGKPRALEFLRNMRMEYQDNQLLVMERDYDRFIRNLAKDQPAELSDDQINNLIQTIINFADESRIRSYFIKYKTGTFFADSKESLKATYKTYYRQLKRFGLAADALLGVDSIPVMTVHKSKGLEYHTVIFIGLEDDAFWTFNRQADEDKCLFFVALSRAKERIIFTFSSSRIGTRNARQSMENIKVLFDHLTQSGIVAEENFVE